MWIAGYSWYRRAIEMVALNAHNSVLFRFLDWNFTCWTSHWKCMAAKSTDYHVIYMRHHGIGALEFETYDGSCHGLLWLHHYGPLVSSKSSLFWIGNSLFFLNCLCDPSYVLVSKRLLDDFPPLLVTAISNFV